MALTPDQHVRVSIGEIFVQNALLNAQLEALTAENASLKDQIAKLIPAAPGPSVTPPTPTQPLSGEVIDPPSNG